MANKLLGYILLAVGLVLIGWSLWQSYQIFTGNAASPAIFKPQAQQVRQPQSGDLQAQFQQQVATEIGKSIPQDAIANALNLLSWSVLAGILVFGGTSIASLGIRLIL